MAKGGADDCGGRGGTPIPLSGRRSWNAEPGGAVPEVAVLPGEAAPVPAGVAARVGSSSGLRRLNTTTPYVGMGAAGAEPYGNDIDISYHGPRSRGSPRGKVLDMFKTWVRAATPTTGTSRSTTGTVLASARRPPWTRTGMRLLA